ncbi:MAG: hypothetical protein ACREM3_25605 [Candidatus Rokuibacteriota bacterium]
MTDMPATAPAAGPPVTDERWGEGRLVLPGGILDDRGVCHKVVHVRELTGRDEEVLTERRYRNGARQVSDLLAQVIVRVDGWERDVDPELAAEMLVGDRDYLLLRLRQLSLGDAVHQIMRCPAPACEEKVDVDFLVSEIPVRRVDGVRPRYDFRLSRPAIAGDERSRRGVLRLPTGRDQEAIAELGAVNPAIANTRLFGRLLQRLGDNAQIDEALIRELPLAVRNELTAVLRATSPGPDLTIGIRCPRCGGDMTYPFDLYSFFLTSWR